ncbi:alpha/beta hydrolase [Flavobacterium sp. IMCC34518]|uniref:alpha/beta hydrolase n=1 Tax=Flavobacterium sp. IMCC34518 TaxID=3003623 RepID=UPI0022ABCB82|nr:alpha/beta hydrolase [Flavobacterium sp. IMCC34518]
MNKIPVYFMPGLAASVAIFERIKLSESEFEMFFLEWEIPREKETLLEYAKRLAEKIKHENPILIGVSFGGILVQEMSRFIKVQKVIIISSVKSNLEFPKRMIIAKNTKAYKLIPLRLVQNIESLAKFSFGEKVNKRLKLYEKFISIRDRYYLDWSIEKIIMWDRKEADQNVIHIHGDEDDVFPIKYITNCIVVKGGTHIMILNKYKWLNENLPKIIHDQYIANEK